MTAAEQRLLQDDIERVHTYGLSHPDEFTSVEFENEPTVRIFAYFCGHVDEHRRELAARVAYPDRLDVRQGVQSAREQNLIMRSIVFDGLIFGAGAHRTGCVEIQMHTTAAARRLASELVDRWGNRVLVALAGHPFPKDSRPDPCGCPREPAPSARIPNVECRLLLDNTTLARGEVGTGVTRIKNNSNAAIEQLTGSCIFGNVTRPGSDGIVAGLAGGWTDVGCPRRAEPGQKIDVPVEFGTDDCAPDGDYSLPPGQYVVSTYLAAFGRSDDAAFRVVAD